MAPAPRSTPAVRTAPSKAGMSNPANGQFEPRPRRNRRDEPKRMIGVRGVESSHPRANRYQAAPLHRARPWTTHCAAAAGAEPLHRRQVHELPACRQRPASSKQAPSPDYGRGGHSSRRRPSGSSKYWTPKSRQDHTPGSAPEVSRRPVRPTQPI